MTLTEEELEQFLDDIDVFSRDTLEPERPELVLPIEKKPQSNPILIVGGIVLAFFIGLSLGLFLNHEDTRPQFTYIIQKLNDLEGSSDLIEPLDTFEQLR